MSCKVKLCTITPKQPPIGSYEPGDQPYGDGGTGVPINWVGVNGWESRKQASMVGRGIRSDFAGAVTGYADREGSSVDMTDPSLASSGTQRAGLYEHRRRSHLLDGGRGQTEGVV